MKKYVLKSPEGTPHFKIDYPAELNPQQLEVVTAGDGPVLVIAGAGSGKTRTITYRVARLIESGIPPGSIMLVTFTNKAAQEMMKRVEMLIGGDVRQVWGGTFHHIGNRILRRHAEVLGYKPNYTIIDRDDAADLIEESASQLHLYEKFPKFPKGGVLIELASLAVNTDISFERLLADRFTVYMDLAEDMVRTFNHYQYKKQQQNIMDFDDLLSHWRKLFVRHPEILQHYQGQFRYLLVDEYQDTNRIQAEIVELLAGHASEGAGSGNLMVVGDDAQSIYSFRGAHFENILNFPKRFPDCKVMKLETNYRSTPEILTLANASIRHNQRQHEKMLQPVKTSGPSPEVVVTSDADEQARFLGQKIGELRLEGYDFKDIAVLYRSHYHSMEVQMELTRRGIPFQVRSGLRFFEQAHIKDVTGYLRIVANPYDEVAWKRVVKLFPRIGNATAEKIWTRVADSKDPLHVIYTKEFEAVLPSIARKGWKDFQRILSELMRDGLRDHPSEMLHIVLENGYRDYLQAHFPNFTARAEDIEQLANFALHYEELQPFLSELALLTNVYGEDVSGEEREPDTVVLTTVHQAKGLEWPVVFVIWLTDGKFPEGKCLREAEGEEEERRLFYVAVTRAKDELYLSYPTMALEYSSIGIVQRPSRFLKELEKGVYEEVVTSYDLNPADKEDEF